MLKDGALPSLNLSDKSIASSKSSHTITRPTLSIQRREEHLEFSTISPPPPSYIYKDFQDFKNRIIKLAQIATDHLEISENLVIATLKSTKSCLACLNLKYLLIIL